MGMYDCIIVPCPTCGIEAEFQSKSGPCNMDTFTLADVPDDVLEDVNRHAPATCECGTKFAVRVEVEMRPVTVMQPVVIGKKSAVWSHDEFPDSDAPIILSDDAFDAFTRDILEGDEPTQALKDLWRESIATTAGCETADIRSVNELLKCQPAGACETHGRCWTHSEWQKCGSLIRTVSSDPCDAIADGLDGLCSGCREFNAMCEQNDAAMQTLVDLFKNHELYDVGGRCMGGPTAQEKIKIDISDPETRATWDAVQQAKEEVASWPAWKRGGSVVEAACAPPDGECWCSSCEDARLASSPLEENLLGRRFILCPRCGNKRCPKATHHGYKCTNSNATGQVGTPEDE